MALLNGRAENLALSYTQQATNVRTGYRTSKNWNYVPSDCIMLISSIACMSGLEVSVLRMHDANSSSYQRVQHVHNKSFQVEVPSTILQISFVLFSNL